MKSRLAVNTHFTQVSADDPHLQELRQRHAQLQKRLSQLREEELWNERQKKSLMNMVEVSLDAEGVLGKAAKRRSEVGEEEGEGEAEEKQRSVDAENVATEVNGAGQEDQQQESEATSTGKRQTNEDSSDAVTEDMLPSLTEEEKEALERLKHSADSNSLTEQLSEIEERIADIQREKGRLQRQIQVKRPHFSLVISIDSPY